MKKHLRKRKQIIWIKIIIGNIEIIQSYVFYGCIALNITIPDSVQSIHDEAFKDVAHVYYNGTATGAPWGARAFN